MDISGIIELWGQAAKTALGFSWKAGWAFVLGYTVSAMIQAFVPKARLTPYLGDAGFKSLSLATLFGTISSSCSFAALATARALVLKGAHFVAAVAFMFASTNLVIELGILILIFLGWQFLAAEVIGGLLLIALSRLLIRLTYPKKWLQDAREKVEQESPPEEDDFDWRRRIKSKEGWRMVGATFAGEWGMVWEEILIGFTIAGVVAALVPEAFWKAIFLSDLASGGSAGFWIALENALLAPFVAAATFIGSMGNIPLATVLNASGVMFAGIMGFIYSDLMVPPLVMVNAKYYGWKVALYIAAVMYVVIVITALALHYGFALVGITPHSERKIQEVAQFALDYTFWMNLAAAALAGTMVWLKRQRSRHQDHHGHDHGHSSGGPGFKRLVAYAAMAFLAGGMICFWISKL
ncbi:MAG: permease [Desulfarculaceae bacterium]|nr:permease [Desulfarculaceae bacterium]MCF8074132.1 permease [Desulfarculaceae bacterium]MCF8103276.1 permease [Desulfarculaceae bacterium]MCF8116866.1 permease [Desulfarculaceae bacterium]